MKTVDCPICKEPDMRCEPVEGGGQYIYCVNLGCASNGGNGATPEPAIVKYAQGLEKKIAGLHRVIGEMEAERRLSAR